MQIPINPGTPRVLLIEDSPEILELLAIELEAAGFAVATAPHGQAGIERARESTPDIVVSDLYMPGFNGHRVLREIRSLPGLESVPAIALSGLDVPVNLGPGRGFDAWVTKPADTQKLAALIRSLTPKTCSSGA